MPEISWRINREGIVLRRPIPQNTYQSWAAEPIRQGR